MHNNTMEAGLRDRPPMLAMGIYAQWQSRFIRYVDTKPNSEALITSKQKQMANKQTQATSNPNKQEVDIIKKAENQAKMTKLSMEWKRLCKIKAKVRVNTEESAVKPEPELKNTIGCNLNPSDGPGKPNTVFLKEDTAYPCLALTKDHKGKKINTPYPEEVNISVVQCDLCELSGLSNVLNIILRVLFVDIVCSVATMFCVVILENYELRQGGFTYGNHLEDVEDVGDFYKLEKGLGIKDGTTVTAKDGTVTNFLRKFPEYKPTKGEEEILKLRSVWEKVNYDISDVIRIGSTLIVDLRDSRWDDFELVVEFESMRDCPPLYVF
ncbi:hypothetical protein Tco_1019783 [Tanacetum coccineum]|uniref:Uncharacterized protein n=1 Tax=Tanacetum coccineum TaxID=301880 RepID=A0ABQ5FZM3_9ASTR